MKNSACYPLFFSTLSNNLRMDIVSSLADSPKSVSKLCKEINVEQSKISHALKILRTCNVVGFTRKGKEKIYKLNNDVVKILNLINEYERKNCKKCGRLK